jgi:hypothetical protein
MGWEKMGWKGKVRRWEWTERVVGRTLGRIIRPGVLDCELPSAFNVYSLVSPERPCGGFEEGGITGL